MCHENSAGQTCLNWNNILYWRWRVSPSYPGDALALDVVDEALQEHHLGQRGQMAAELRIVY
eukprot:3761330-Amphidinium_carterae.1